MGLHVRHLSGTFRLIACVYACAPRPTHNMIPNSSHIWGDVNKGFFTLTHGIPTILPCIATPAGITKGRSLVPGSALFAHRLAFGNSRLRR